MGPKQKRMHAPAESFGTSSVLQEKKQYVAPLEDNPVDCQDNIVATVQTEDWYECHLLVLVAGASGDLAKKKTYPALFQLYKAKLLPKFTVIWGFARTNKTHKQLREHLRPALLRNMNNEIGEVTQVENFLSRCFYKAGKSYGDWEVISQILHAEETLHNLLVYLAIPPNVFGQCAEAVRKALESIHDELHETPEGDVCDDEFLPGFVRVVLEKPFGMDTESCRELLRTLEHQNWSESSLYRIDHYLGKEMVQNILTFREHNLWLRPLWKEDAIEAVHIILKENFGTQGRGGYFDSTGIVRDVVQNHLLQVLLLIGMELPSSSTDKEHETDRSVQERIRNAKVDVLRSMPPIKLENSLLGQYVGYKDDPTIENPETTTPTYTCMRCEVNTEPWKGVPFILEGGKALNERLCEVRMYFKGKATDFQNALVLRLQPTPSIFLTTNMKKPGFSQTAVSTHMGIDYGHFPLPEAYTRLLLDVLRGKRASFVRNDELLGSWELFTPVLHQMEREQVQPCPYEEGSDGPTERESFLRSMGVTKAWLPLPSKL